MTVQKYVLVSGALVHVIGNGDYVKAREYDALAEAAACVANAIHSGLGSMIKDTLMEQELRNVLGLKPGEYRNIPKGTAVSAKEQL